MKNSITILSVVLLVSLGFTGVAQKSEQMNFKEMLSAKKSQQIEKNKTKLLKEVVLSKGQISKPGNSEDYVWNDTDWDYITDTEYSYNAKGFPTEELSTDAFSGDSVSKTTWTWDSHDNQTEFIDYYWNGTEWEISWGSKHIYTYDVNENITEEVYQYWSLDSWVNSSKYTYEYDNNGFKISMISQDWENDEWVYDRRYFDIVWHNWDQWQIQSWNCQIWEGVWIDIDRYNAIFTGDTYVGIYEEYDNNTWVYSERETYTQTPTEQIYLWENYENKGWVNSSRYSQFYDDHGSYTGSRDEYWENEEWVIDWEYSYLFTYNANNDITEMVSMNWDWETQTLENSERHVYSNFQYFQSDVKKINSLSDVMIFPNPVEDILNIDIQNENLTESVVQIMNITGQKVYEGILSGRHTTINLNSLSNGIYILRLQTKENKILNYKILKD